MEENKGVPTEDEKRGAVSTSVTGLVRVNGQPQVLDKINSNTGPTIRYCAPKSKISLRGHRGNLYYAVFAANLGAMAMGPHYSWPSPTIPILQTKDSWLPLTNEEASWVVSLEIFGTMLGPFFGGWLVNMIGLRWTILTGVTFGCVSWSILLASSAVWHLYVGRFVGGIGGGMEFLACPMYTAEIAEPAVRGALGSIFAFFLVGGYQIGYIAGPYVSYTWLILICLVPTMIFFLLFPLVPESPYYYLRKGQPDDALQSLAWLRSGRLATEVQSELDEIQREVQKSLEEPAKISDLVATKGTRKALMLSLSIVIAQPLTGIDCILSYTENIFIMAGISSLAKIFAIIVGLMLFVSHGLSSPLARVFGIKNVLVVSGFGSSVFQVLLGIYFYLQQNGNDISQLSWVPVCCLVGYILFFAIGIGPLAWAVVAEVFPPRVKPLASAIATFSNKFFAFLVTKFFIQASIALGPHIVMFFFSLCCLLAGLFVLFFLPDTRGMTLPQILKMLEGSQTERQN